MRYYTADGTALADLTMTANGQMTPMPVTSVNAAAAVQPDFGYKCFFKCIGKPVATVCANSCGLCANGAGPPACVACIACAGTFGIICAKQCRSAS